MKKNTPSRFRSKVVLIATSLSLVLGSAHSATLLNFPFNEGTNYNVLDTAQGIMGTFGTASFDPSVDTVALTTDSPSGQVGDGSFVNSGTGFLITEDTTGVLEITNGPITMESWVKIDPNFLGANEGIMAYGASYKLGLRSGLLTFTLFGKKDVGNSFVAVLPLDEWFHVATVWNPGVGVDFYVTTNGVTTATFVEDTNTTARAIQHNYLSVGNEGFSNPLRGSFDRVRIHNAVLSAGEIDNDAANPKPTYASTKVSYAFNESDLPATNSVAPALPLEQGNPIAAAAGGPAWTSDTPTGLEGDFALSFLSTAVPRPVVTVNYGSTPVDLSENNSSYTLQAWVKPSTEPLDERRVIYRSDGPAPRIALSINANRTMHTTVLGTADFTTSVSIPNDNRWHHIAVSMEDFLTLRFYLDGVLRQTVTRTQTGAASSGGTPRLLIGKESDARYFRGVLDRVVIDNEVLSESTIDFPAIPGLATFDTFESHPANLAVEPGSQAVFTATPTSPSAATYQWFYRTNQADEGIAISGETSTTFTINNVGPDDLGFYSLAVSNEVGVTESYGAQLSFAVDLSSRLIDFEAPTYTSGLLDGQDGWITEVNQGTTRVLTTAEIAAELEATGRTAGATVHSGSQALLFTGSGIAVNSFRTFTGLETEPNVTLNAWVRALAPGNTGAPVANVFLRMQSSTGVNAAGFRIGPNYSIDYGLIAGAWVPSGIVADTETFNKITIQLDYTARTYDFFVDDVKINVDPVPFYTATSDSFSRINLFKGANQSGWIMDDLIVQGPTATGPTLSVQKTESGLVISWPASFGGYFLESTDSLSATTWSTVSHTTVGDENQAIIEATGTSKFYQLRKIE